MQNILLAAGLASRSKGEKLFLPWRGETVLQHAVRASLEAELDTIVVTGFKRTEVERLLGVFADSNLELVFNPDFAFGQGSSTICGAKHLKEGEDFFISLADMPLINAAHYTGLLGKIGEAAALRPVFKGKPGHPVLLKSGLKEVILSQNPDFRMKDMLSAYTVKTCIVDDEAYVSDIDTIQAYRVLLLKDSKTNHPFKATTSSP
ncbi:putative MobA-like protein [Sphaerochaeta pleomorpha str. Grapes]|uniref:Putative MobA-like protein n=1 Tax=Sphaerochaeta pleomorpha (strain ATCC BAA-1885 / DSM 22778 / Grapes) TaxID=158190 RepID=G8QRH1_SPHPG|nr:nucleotidyltransferase family protein [Sphaerochaeta pleomorpha]AEV29893.1 putative MobA-like protein [Sphaerochaeta pleomorpha str. Grapes]